MYMPSSLPSSVCAERRSAFGAPRCGRRRAGAPPRAGDRSGGEGGAGRSRGRASRRRRCARASRRRSRDDRRRRRRGARGGLCGSRVGEEGADGGGEARMCEFAQPGTRGSRRAHRDRAGAPGRVSDGWVVRGSLERADLELELVAEALDAAEHAHRVPSRSGGRAARRRSRRERRSCRSRRPAPARGTERRARVRRRWLAGDRETPSTTRSASSSAIAATASLGGRRL